MAKPKPEKKGVLTPQELDALQQTLSRQRHLWARHEALEKLGEAPRTFNPGYTDTELLYEELTSEFSDADATAKSRDELLARVDALTRRLETEYAVALRDSRARSEFDAMVAEIIRTIRGA